MIFQLFIQFMHESHSYFAVSEVSPPTTCLARASRWQDMFNEFRQCPSTIALLLLSNAEPGKSSPASLVDLTGSGPCTYTPEETPSLWSYKEHRSENYPESDLQSPCQFTPSTSTIVDDNIFSRFVRSPPRDEILSGLKTLNEPPALADEPKTKACLTALTRNGSSTEMASLL